MILGRMLTAGGAYDNRAAYFDGSTWLSRGADLTGIADSAVFTISMWVRRLSPSPENPFVICQTNLAFGIGLNVYGNSNANRVIFQSSGTSTGEMQARSVDAMSLDNWSHVIGCFDATDQNKCAVYVDGAATSGPVIYFTNNSVFDFTIGNFFVGSNGGGTRAYQGYLAELWFTTQYIDLTVSANRLKFRTSGGAPADMGKAGTVPLGAQPFLYLRDYRDFALGRNRGKGGNFSIVGGPIEEAAGPW